MTQEEDPYNEETTVKQFLDDHRTKFERIGKLMGMSFEQVVVDMLTDVLSVYQEMKDSEIEELVELRTTNEAK